MDFGLSWLFGCSENDMTPYAWPPASSLQRPASFPSKLRTSFSYSRFPAMTFASLGLIDPLLRTLESLDYTKPTPVQAKASPLCSKVAT